jgi:hypothetical protein
MEYLHSRKFIRKLINMKKEKKQLTESESKQIDQDILFIRQAIEKAKKILKEKYGKDI